MTARTHAAKLCWAKTALAKVAKPRQIRVQSHVAATPRQVRLWSRVTAIETEGTWAKRRPHCQSNRAFAHPAPSSMAPAQPRAHRCRRSSLPQPTGTSRVWEDAGGKRHAGALVISLVALPECRTHAHANRGYSMFANIGENRETAAGCDVLTVTLIRCWWLRVSSLDANGILTLFSTNPPGNCLPYPSRSEATRSWDVVMYIGARLFAFDPFRKQMIAVPSLQSERHLSQRPRMTDPPRSCQFSGTERVQFIMSLQSINLASSLTMLICSF